MSFVFHDPKSVDLAGLGYLARVHEAAPPISDSSPIWIRHGTVEAGPPHDAPEQHPCCEFGIQLEGEGVEYVGSEHLVRKPGDIFLSGPGLPHWIEITHYPLKFITVFFRATLAIEMGPDGDGLQILSRFTAPQPIARRLINPPKLSRFLRDGFEQLAQEWDARAFGREVRLRALLFEMLIQLIRHEQSTGIAHTASTPEIDWRPLQAALMHLHTNFNKTIYTRDVAACAGVTRQRLQMLFRTAMGMSWGEYLRNHRIKQAAGLLLSSDQSVIDIAWEVGFETLSHFNATFRTVMGVSPGEFRRRRGLDRKDG